MEKNYILTLNNDKKYALVNSLKYNDKDYVYLSLLSDYKEYMICEVIDEEVLEVKDKNLLGQLILEFSKIS